MHIDFISQIDRFHTNNVDKNDRAHQYLSIHRNHQGHTYFHVEYLIIND